MNNDKYILIVNQFNSDNIGDKLLNSLLCRNIELLGYRTINCGFAQTTLQNIEFTQNKNLKLVFKRNVKKYLPEQIKYYLKYKKRLDIETYGLDIKKCIAVVIGGGQLIKHNSVFKECFSFWVDWARKNGKPCFVYGVGVDSNLTVKERSYYRKKILDCEYINCRDYKSKEILENELNISNVRLAPDIAFTLDKELDTNQNMILVMPYAYDKAVSAFNMQSTKEQYYEDIITNVTHMNRDTRIVLSATTSSDAEECFELLEYFKANSFIATIKIIQNSEELIELVSDSEYVITGRMHAMIVAKLLGKKVIPLLVSDKIRQFCLEYLPETKQNVDLKKLAFEGVVDLVKSIEVTINDFNYNSNA